MHYSECIGGMLARQSFHMVYSQSRMAFSGPKDLVVKAFEYRGSCIEPILSIALG